jgi:hypothetical protein
MNDGNNKHRTPAQVEKRIQMDLDETPTVIVPRYDLEEETEEYTLCD